MLQATNATQRRPLKKGGCVSPMAATDSRYIDRVVRLPGHEASAAQEGRIAAAVREAQRPQAPGRRVRPTGHVALRSAARVAATLAREVGVEAVRLRCRRA